MPRIVGTEASTRELFFDSLAVLDLIAGVQDVLPAHGVVGVSPADEKPVPGRVAIVLTIVVKKYEHTDIVLTIHLKMDRITPAISKQTGVYFALKPHHAFNVNEFYSKYLAFSRILGASGSQVNSNETSLFYVLQSWPLSADRKWKIV